MLLNERMTDLISSSCIWKCLTRDKHNVLKLRGEEEGIKEFQKIHFLQPHVRQKPFSVRKQFCFRGGTYMSYDGKSPSILHELFWCAAVFSSTSHRLLDFFFLKDVYRFIIPNYIFITPNSISGVLRVYICVRPWVVNRETRLKWQISWVVLSEHNPSPARGEMSCSKLSSHGACFRIICTEAVWKWSFLTWVLAIPD